MQKCCACKNPFSYGELLRRWPAGLFRGELVCKKCGQRHRLKNTSIILSSAGVFIVLSSAFVSLDLPALIILQNLKTTIMAGTLAYVRPFFGLGLGSVLWLSSPFWASWKAIPMTKTRH